MRNFLDKATAVGAMALISVMGAIAQPAWPDRAIKVIVPYTPGGGTDTVVPFKKLRTTFARNKLNGQR